MRFLITLLLASCSAIAADIPKPYVHYRSEDIRSEGASVLAWAEQTIPARWRIGRRGEARVWHQMRYLARYVLFALDE